MELHGVVLLWVVTMVTADVYLHMPRGSNNRLDESSRNRKKNNRLFDSQNNQRGGYNVGERDTRIKYYVGSILNIEWTNQHQCGGKNAHCDIILQYMCDEELSDRDRNGRHESAQYYTDCRNRLRNPNLYTADQKLRGNTAQYTRQNPNGKRSGLECPEERDYYPYHAPTPWRDIAILTDDDKKCSTYKKESQNKAEKGYCLYKKSTRGKRGTPWNKEDCEAREKEGFKWEKAPPHDLPLPDCQKADVSRDNHLGNTASPKPPNSRAPNSKSIPQTLSYEWKIPDTPAENCALRIRYNISSSDYPSLDSGFPQADKGKSLYEIYGFKEEDEAKERGYYFENNPTIKPLEDEKLQDRLELQLAINTAQVGRTFQDRSHAFSILARPTELANAKIHNVAVRGKRGNIVQVYPAVEYDFTPNDLVVKKNDYVHVQWTGSLRNPRKNDGEGRRGTDKSNVITLSPDKAKRNVYGVPGNSYPANLTAAESNSKRNFLGLGYGFAAQAALSLSGKALDDLERRGKRSIDKGKSLYEIYGFKEEDEAEERGYSFENNPKIKPLEDEKSVGRTFEDRSHAFSVLTLPSELAKAKIHNVGVREKRGKALDDLEKKGKRSIDIPSEENDPTKDKANDDGDESSEISDTMSDITAIDKQFQRIVNGIDSLLQDDVFKRGTRSMELLDGAPTYFDLKPQKAVACGKWHYMCTRNNNFSNRSQKGKIQVTC